MFGKKSKRIAELELLVNDTQLNHDKLADENEMLRHDLANQISVVNEVRAALKVPEDEEVTHYCWGLQMTLETNKNLLEGAANVIKAADEWFANQKKAKRKRTKKKA